MKIQFNFQFDYIFLFIHYCLAHSINEQEPQKNDLESLPDGKQLFTIAQRMRNFEQNPNNRLDLSCITSLFDVQDSAKNVLEIFLDILPTLTTKPIESIDLSYNELTELTHSIGCLSQLKNLDLSYNKITKLSSIIGNLTQLEYLNLSLNFITELADSIEYLSKLKHLNLSNNKITELPHSIEYLTQLERLDLSNNKITELADSIGYLTLLRQLDLRHNNKLTKIPVGLKRQGLIVYKDSRVVFVD